MYIFYKEARPPKHSSFCKSDRALPWLKKILLIPYCRDLAQHPFFAPSSKRFLCWRGIVIKRGKTSQGPL